MATTIAQLKQNRGGELAKLNAAMEKLAGNNRSDERFWAPTADKAGTGSATLRLLPPPPDEDVAFVMYYDHGFVGPSGIWYIENCRSSIGGEDPVNEMNKKLWNQGEDSRGRK